MVIFFDLDDTLIDSQSAITAAARDLHTHSQLNQPLETFLYTWRTAHHQHYPRYLAGQLSYESLRRLRIRQTITPHLTDSEADDLFDFYLAAYEANWTIFPDVLPCLDALTDHVLGIITNGPSREQRRKLSRFGIDSHFQHILISEECSPPKPHPAIFHRACELAGVLVTEAIHIGDHLDLDYRAAITAGLRAIWLNRHATPNIIPPIDTISSLNQLPNRL